MTPHYRGAHAAAKFRFSCYQAVGARLGGAGGSSRVGRGFDPRVAELIE